MSPRARVLLLLVLVLGALALRGARLEWGLPEVHEEATPVREAVEFWGEPGGSIDLDPGFFRYPSLTFYLQFSVQAAWYFGKSLAGQVESLNDFRQFLAEDFGTVVLVARWVQAILGALLVIPVFVLGRRLAGDTAGFVAAAVIAVLPVAVAESRVVGPDAALALFAACALAAATGVARRGARSDYLWTGLWIGLATGAKYPGALLAIALLAAHLVHRRRTGERGPALLPLGEAVLVAGAVFVLTSPFVVLRPTAFLADFRFERAHMMAGHLGREEGRAFLWYLGSALPRAWTVAGIVLAGLGLVAAFLRREVRYRAIPGAVFAAVLLAVLGSWTMAADRYALPLAPLAAAWIGVLVASVTARVPVPRARAAAAAALAALCLVLPLRASILHVERDGREDSRAAAAAWIAEHVPAGDTILLERYGPTLDPGRNPILNLPFHGVEPHLYDPAYSPVLYSTFDWIVLSSGVHDRYLAHPREYPAQAQFYASLGRGFHEVARFDAGTYAGPTILVLARRDDSDLGTLENIPVRFFDELAGRTELAEYLSQLGTVLVRGGDEERGFLMLRRATEMDPACVSAWGNLGAMELRRGRFEAALTAFSRARDLAPEDGQIQYNLAILHQRDGERTQAIDAYQRALLTRPDIEPAWTGLARVLVEEERYADARRVLREFLDRFPRAAQAEAARTALDELSRLGPGRP